MRPSVGFGVQLCGSVSIGIARGQGEGDVEKQADVMNAGPRAQGAQPSMRIVALVGS